MVTIGPRVYYAMAKNGAFLKAAAVVHPDHFVDLSGQQLHAVQDWHHAQETAPSPADLKEPVPEDVQLVKAVELLKEMPDISNITQSNGDIIQADFVGDDRALHKILAQLITHDLPVVSFAPRSGGGRLEEVFMSITEGSHPS